MPSLISPSPDHRAKTMHRVRVKLGHTRFAHPEDGSNLAERALLLIVKSEDLLELRGKRRDRFGDCGSELLLAQAVVHVLVRGLDLEIVEIDQLEARHAAGGDALEEISVVVDRQIEGARDLLLFRSPPLLAGEGADGVGHLARGATKLTRRGVEAAKII